MLKEKTTLEKQLAHFETTQRRFDDAKTLLELGEEMGDAASKDEGLALLPGVEDQLKVLELQKMLSGPNDHLN